MNKDSFNKKLGDNARRLREKKKTSKQALSKEINKERISIIRLEQGKLNPSYYFMLEIANGLGAHISELTKGIK